MADSIVSVFTENLHSIPEPKDQPSKSLSYSWTPLFHEIINILILSCLIIETLSNLFLRSLSQNSYLSQLKASWATTSNLRVASSLSTSLELGLGVGSQRRYQGQFVRLGSNHVSSTQAIWSLPPYQNCEKTGKSSKMVPALDLTIRMTIA